MRKTYKICCSSYQYLGWVMTSSLSESYLTFLCCKRVQNRLFQSHILLLLPYSILPSHHNEHFHPDPTWLNPSFPSLPPYLNWWANWSLCNTDNVLFFMEKYNKFLKAYLAGLKEWLFLSVFTGRLEDWTKWSLLVRLLFNIWWG